jgi:hypothetical protein
MGFRSSKFIFLIGMLVAITGCEGIVDLDVPAASSRLAAYGFLNPDSVFSITLYRTATPTEVIQTDDLLINDATVVITNDQRQDTLRSNGRGRYIHPFLKPSTEQAYMLEVAAPDLPPIRAHNLVPSRPQTTVRAERVGSDERTIRYRFDLTLIDRAGPNFYRVGIYTFIPPDQRQQDRAWVAELFRSTDPILRNSPASVGSLDIEGNSGSYQVAYFQDDVFEGETRTIDLEVDFFRTPPDQPLATVHVVVTSMNEAYFEYHRSLALQRRNEGDPLADPVDIYSNIENGAGIFSSYANRVHILHLENDK